MREQASREADECAGGAEGEVVAEQLSAERSGLWAGVLSGSVVNAG